jgi:hypothetical protein
MLGVNVVYKNGMSGWESIMVEPEPMVPARLLDDVRVSMKELLTQNVNAWGEVDRLHGELRQSVELLQALYNAWGEERIAAQMGTETLERFQRVLRGEK